MADIVFKERAWTDYLYWTETDKKIAQKINSLLRDISRGGNDGLGKPEALRHDYAGYWSRRITDEHRLVYKVDGEKIIVASCRYHYDA